MSEVAALRKELRAAVAAEAFERAAELQEELKRRGDDWVRECQAAFAAGFLQKNNCQPSGKIVARPVL